MCVSFLWGIWYSIWVIGVDILRGDEGLIFGRGRNSFIERWLYRVGFFVVVVLVKFYRNLYGGCYYFLFIDGFRKLSDLFGVI